jgi:hypothetical protein
VVVVAAGWVVRHWLARRELVPSRGSGTEPVPVRAGAPVTASAPVTAPAPVTASSVTVTSAFAPPTTVTIAVPAEAVPAEAVPAEAVPAGGPRRFLTGWLPVSQTPNEPSR